MRQPRQPRPPREPRVKETNRLTPCPTCGAPVGEVCFRIETGKELGKTHRTIARDAARGEGWFRQADDPRGTGRSGGARARRTERRTAVERGIRRQQVREVAALGKIKPVKPEALRGDGSPILGEGQVYVTRTGTRYHPYWCNTVADKWDANPKALLVANQAEVVGREECRTCRVGL